MLLALSSPSGAADYPEPATADHVIRDFGIAIGATPPELRIHHRTLGVPRRGEKVSNAVLIVHGTTGSGARFLRPMFAGELCGAGQPLDATRDFLILPDGVGHGGSSKPSDGLRARFPRYSYGDMIGAQHRRVTEGIGVDHRLLVMGTSMGGMHAWLGVQIHPGFRDALLPLASVSAPIAGRNRAWRRAIIDAIRSDPAWERGEYRARPPSLRTAAGMLFLRASNPVERQEEAPTRVAADRLLDESVTRTVKALGANDVLSASESSADYGPGPGPGRIAAPLLALNFEDDLINPPELGALGREIRRLTRGKAVVVPRSDRARGHGTHTLAAVRKEHRIALPGETGR